MQREGSSSYPQYLPPVHRGFNPAIRGCQPDNYPSTASDATFIFLPQLVRCLLLKSGSYNILSLAFGGGRTPYLYMLESNHKILGGPASNIVPAGINKKGGLHVRAGWQLSILYMHMLLREQRPLLLYYPKLHSTIRPNPSGLLLL
jgi:hypothetical protein